MYPSFIEHNLLTLLTNNQRYLPYSHVRLKIDLLVQGLLVETGPYLSSEGPPEAPCPLALYAVLLRAQCCYSTGQVSPHPHLQPGTVPSHTANEAAGGCCVEMLTPTCVWGLLCGDVNPNMCPGAALWRC